jgi:hypothetical protein
MGATEMTMATYNAPHITTQQFRVLVPLVYAGFGIVVLLIWAGLGFAH